MLRVSSVLNSLTAASVNSSSVGRASLLLRKRFTDVHPLVWEFFSRLDLKRRAFDSAYGEKQLGKAAWEHEIKWRSAYSADFDLAEEVSKHLAVIEDAATLRTAPAASSEESAELLKMCDEEEQEALEKLAMRKSDVAAAVDRHVRASDAVANASSVWTMEIVGKAGGEEAGLFARDLAGMYRHYAENSRGWKVEEQLGAQTTDPNILRITGSDVYLYFQHEIGIHKVQRVPVTDHDGKMQTSTAAVSLLPVIDPSSVEVFEKDCKLDFVRGSGPGGQGMQSSSNACCLTHIPSGISVKCHQSRSATGNKLLALEMVAQQLWKRKLMEVEKSSISARSAQSTSGERSERIRTYNFPQNRVSEHRLGRDFPLGPFIVGGAELQDLHDAMIKTQMVKQVESCLSRLLETDMELPKDCK
jgi:peptide chain release factor 1